MRRVAAVVVALGVLAATSPAAHGQAEESTFLVRGAGATGGNSPSAWASVVGVHVPRADAPVASTTSGSGGGGGFECDYASVSGLLRAAGIAAAEHFGTHDPAQRLDGTTG